MQLRPNQSNDSNSSDASLLIHSTYLTVQSSSNMPPHKASTHIYQWDGSSSVFEQMYCVAAFLTFRYRRPARATSVTSTWLSGLKTATLVLTCSFFSANFILDMMLQQCLLTVVGIFAACCTHNMVIIIMIYNKYDKYENFQDIKDWGLELEICSKITLILLNVRYNWRSWSQIEGAMLQSTLHFTPNTQTQSLLWEGIQHTVA